MSTYLTDIRNHCSDNPEAERVGLIFLVVVICFILVWFLFVCFALRFLEPWNECSSLFLKREKLPSAFSKSAWWQRNLEPFPKNSYNSHYLGNADLDQNPSFKGRWQSSAQKGGFVPGSKDDNAQSGRLVPEPQGINSKAQSTTQTTRAQTSGGSRLHYHTDETVREEILKVVFKRFEDRYQEKKKWFNYFPQFLKGVLLFASLKQNLTHQTVLKMKLNKPYITLSTEPSTQQAANVLLNIETPEVNVWRVGFEEE